jgi:hypothetical protein
VRDGVVVLCNHDLFEEHAIAVPKIRLVIPPI